jgi:hypothetical protein
MQAQTAFPMSRLLYLAFSSVLGILGLFAIARAQDLGMTVFGAGLTIFGLAFVLFLVECAMNEAYGE